MTITTKFAPGDTIWYAHPLSSGVASSVVEFIDINIDQFNNVTILNYTTTGTLSYYVNDSVAFATQAELVLAFLPKIALAGTGVLTYTGVAPTVVVAAP